MADLYCALCGAPLDEFSQTELDCCGIAQHVCFFCSDELSPMDPVRRTRVLLTEGRAVAAPDAMHQVLSHIDASEASRRNPAATDFKCLRCGAPMAKLGRKKLQLGEDDPFLETNLWAGVLELDVLRCTSCRKVEFFTPEEENEHG